VTSAVPDELTTTTDVSASMTAAPDTAENGAAARGNALLQVLRDQRKTIGVAFVLVVATYWIVGQLDRWTLAGCIAGGVALGLANHLATELWLLRIITSGAQPTRNQMVVSTLAHHLATELWLLKTIRSGEEVTRGKLARATFLRLLVLTVVAVGIAVAFWPDGIGLLLGLAIFRLIALVMTTLPLLKELKTP
jgi:hypothetical protein